MGILAKHLTTEKKKTMQTATVIMGLLKVWMMFIVLAYAVNYAFKKLFK